MKFIKTKNYDDIPKFTTDEIQKILENWVLHLKKKNLKGSAIKSKLNAVELFLEMNKVLFHKKILHKLLPSDDYVLGGDVPFTNEDIQRMLTATTKLRTKALIHFLASTGTRPGAVTDPVLRKKHLVEMPHGCMAIKIYDNSKEGFWAFLTPEASKAFNNYFESRKRNGEKLTEESPLFANLEKETNNKKNAYISSKSVRQLIANVLVAAGIERIKTGNRYDKAVIYGFRKRFNTILKLDNNINSNIAEKLMAHKNGLDGSYLKPTREQCFSEFIKAIPELTISDEFRDKFKIKALENEKTELEKLKQQVSDVQNKLENEVEFRSAFDDFVKGSYDGLKKMDPDKIEKKGYGLLLLNIGKIPNEFHMPLENLILLANMYPHLAKAMGENRENLVMDGDVIKIKKH